MSIRKLLLLFLAAMVGIPLALYGLMAMMLFIPVSRSLDKEPVVLTTDGRQVEAGVAEVSIAINTGGDQMSVRRVQAGLVLVVRYGNTYAHQTFASCNSSGYGGDPSDPYSLGIECDGRTFFLVQEKESIRVTDGIGGNTVVSIPLPSGITEVRTRIH